MIKIFKRLKSYLSKYAFGKKIIAITSNIRFLLNISFFKFDKFLRSFFGTQKYKELMKLKNKYSGKRCFIVATGPSMKLKFLNNLKNEYTFSMNNITKYFDKTKWRPTFYVIQDLEALEENIKTIEFDYKKTKKNLPTIEFLKKTKMKNDKKKFIWKNSKEYTKPNHLKINYNFLDEVK